jgi:hypothetical protein
MWSYRFEALHLSNSYMWLYRTSGDTEAPIVLYEYQPDRRAKRPKEFLEGFKEYVRMEGMKDTITFREALRYVVAGHMPDGNSNIC